MKNNYLNGLTEFEIVLLAKNGDQNAIELLWKKYRKIMINVLWNIPMDIEEKESEAFDVFIHHLKNVFNQEKVKKTKEEWLFFNMLYQGMLNRRNKLLRRKINLSYDESEFESESNSNILNAEKVSLSNMELFLRYNYENNIVLKLDFEMKMITLYSHLNEFQKTIMALVQKGLSIERIAQKLNHIPFQILCTYKIIEKKAKEIFYEGDYMADGKTGNPGLPIKRRPATGTPPVFPWRPPLIRYQHGGKPIDRGVNHVQR
jgi:hypothetical protein